MSDTKLPDVWIVIPTWNRRDDLLECLASVAESTYSHYHVLVVDNASEDGSAEAVGELFPHVQLLRLDRNQGATGASNRGFDLALEGGADYVFRLDSDAIVDSMTLSHLVSAALATPDAGVMTPKIYYADRPDVIWSAGGWANRWHFGARGVDPSGLCAMRDQEPIKIDYAWSTGVLLSRDVLLSTQGFDEDFFVYFEEVDFCRRARQNGFGIFLVPQAKLWHKVGSAANSPWTARHWNRSKILLYCKHSRGLHRVLLLLYALAYALFRAVFPKPGKGNRGPLPYALSGMIEGFAHWMKS